MEAAEAADERLHAALDKALARLEELLDSDDAQVQIRAVIVTLDRVLGRPGQRLEHAGRLELHTPPNVEHVREKLGRLIESRVAAIAEQRMVEQNGDAD